MGWLSAHLQVQAGALQGEGLVEGVAGGPVQQPPMQQVKQQQGVEQTYHLHSKQLRVGLTGCLTLPSLLMLLLHLLAPQQLCHRRTMLQG